MDEDQFRYKDTRMTETPTPKAEQPSENPDQGKAEKQPAPPAPPEATMFQIVYNLYDDEQHMRREGLPTNDGPMAHQVAANLMRRHDVREVFICTVHAAFTKEVNIKKVI